LPNNIPLGPPEYTNWKYNSNFAKQHQEGDDLG